MVKRLADSTIFSNLIMSDGITNKISRIKFTPTTEGGSLVPSEEISTELSTIENRVKHATKVQVMDLYSRGGILVIDDKEVKLPSYLGVMALKNRASEDRVLVDITPYRSQTKNVSVTTLYALLQNALVSHEFSTNWDKYTGNASFMQHSAVIYSQLNMKVLDKLYAVNMNSVDSDFLAFLFAKFFLVNMAGRTYSSTTDSMAYKACFNRTSIGIIQDKEREINMDGELYKDIIHLIQHVNTLPEFNIKFRSFFENYIRMYGDSTVLAIDFLPSFYHAIFSTAVGGNLNKEFAIEKVAGRGLIIKAYSEFSRLL